MAYISVNGGGVNYPVWGADMQYTHSWVLCDNCSYMCKNTCNTTCFTTCVNGCLSDCVGICNSCTGSCISQTNASVHPVNTPNNTRFGIFAIDRSNNIINSHYYSAGTVRSPGSSPFYYNTADYIYYWSIVIPYQSRIPNYNDEYNYAVLHGRQYDYDPSTNTSTDLGFHINFTQYYSLVNKLANNWYIAGGTHDVEMRTGDFQMALMLKYYRNSRAAKLITGYSSYPEYSTILSDYSQYGNRMGKHSNYTSFGFTYYMIASYEEIPTSSTLYNLTSEEKQKYYPGGQSRLGIGVNGSQHNYENCGDYVNKLPDPFVHNPYVDTVTSSKPRITNTLINTGNSWIIPREVKLKVGGTWKTIVDP